MSFATEFFRSLIPGSRANHRRHGRKKNRRGRTHTRSATLRGEVLEPGLLLTSFNRDWVTVLLTDMWVGKVSDRGNTQTATAAHGAFDGNPAQAGGDPLVDLLRDGGDVTYQEDNAPKTTIYFDEGIFSSIYANPDDEDLYRMADGSVGIDWFDWIYEGICDVDETSFEPGSGEGTLEIIDVKFEPENQERIGAITFNQPLQTPFSIALKAGTSYAVYAFSQVPEDTHQLSFDTQSMNRGLSNVSEFFVWIGDKPAIDLIKTGVFQDENGDGYADVGETICFAQSGR